MAQNGVGPSITVVRVVPTNRNPEIWQWFDLCEMSEGENKARCKLCGRLFKPGANTTLKYHVEKYCKLYDESKIPKPTNDAA